MWTNSGWTGRLGLTTTPSSVCAVPEPTLHPRAPATCTVEKYCNIFFCNLIFPLKLKSNYISKIVMLHCKICTVWVTKVDPNCAPDCLCSQGETWAVVTARGEVHEGSNSQRTRFKVLHSNFLHSVTMCQRGMELEPSRNLLLLLLQSHARSGICICTLGHVLTQTRICRGLGWIGLGRDLNRVGIRGFFHVFL